MQQINLSISGNVYNFPEIVKVVGDQDPTAPDLYAWVAGILGAPMDQCHTLQAEASFGLLEDLPVATYQDPTGLWQLSLIQGLPVPVGWLQEIGVGYAPASPWELVWAGQGRYVLEDLLFYTY